MNILLYQFIQKLSQLEFVKRIILFGSRARGDHQPTSDIDLAIECPTATDYDWLSILVVIDDADTLLKIDCIRLDQSPQELTAKINREGKVLYERKN